ncbi:hypothetical protein IJ579_08345 [bacterium]|nr:hypothetical protein [bacterium]
MKKNYQMITVYEYLNLLDGKEIKLNEEEDKIRTNVEKYLLSIRRADTNARILETLLA